MATEPIEPGGSREPPGPCDAEPCKSALDAYFALAEKGMDLALKAAIQCLSYKLDRDRFRDAYLMWVAAVGLVALCTWLDMLAMAPRGLCAVLWAMAILASGLVMTRYWQLQSAARRLQEAQQNCETAKSELLKAKFIKIPLVCPPFCFPPDVEIKCGCD